MRLLTASVLLALAACGGGDGGTAGDSGAAAADSNDMAALGKGRVKRAPAPAPEPAPAPAPAPAPEGWSMLALEGQVFSVSGTQTVRYGSGTSWVVKDVAGGGTCSNEFFGNDPLYGTFKQCELSSTPPLVAIPLPLPLPSPVPMTPTVGGSTTGVAELPRASVDTTMPVPTGRTINLAAGGDLQGALNAAQPGDVVVLAAGATFVGNFELPAKANAAGRWITVRSGGSIPAPGTRVSPADAGQMPKLLTPNSMPVISTAAGAEGWRLIGLEVGPAASSPMAYHLVGFGGAPDVQTSLDQVPSRLVLDRSYVHGTPTYDLRRCISLNSSASAVIDSYITDCHSNNSDSQGIYGWNGPGPFLIQNNYVAGGGMGVFFGGQTPGIAGLLPSDITVRQNHITRPMSWRGVWRVKNLFELKAARRVLLEGNVLENNWVDAQSGVAVLLQTLSDDNNMPGIAISDITIRHNIIRRTPSGLTLLARVAYNGGALPAEPMSRVVIENNAFALDGTLGAAPRAIQLGADLRDVTLARNTVVDVNGSPLRMGVFFWNDGIPASGVRLVNNAFGPAEYSVVGGDGTIGALDTFARYAPGAVVIGNALTGDRSALYSAGNYFPGNLTEAGLAGAAAGSYGLALPLSWLPAGAAAPGVDAAAISAATAGVVR
jgi:hypothetical protein